MSPPADSPMKPTNPKEKPNKEMRHLEKKAKARKEKEICKLPQTGRSSKRKSKKDESLKAT